jgi:DNA repair exonuclease SbcCD ATPase subunit
MLASQKKCQIAALRSFLSRTRCHDHEKVRTAFAKWVRLVTHPTKAPVEYSVPKLHQELNMEFQAVERHREELRNRELRLEENRIRLEKQKFDHRRVSESLRTQQVAAEKESIELASKANVLKTKVSEMHLWASDLAQKQEQLIVWEEKISKREEEMVIQAKDVEEMNSKVRSMAKTLRSKQRELEIQETRLRMELQSTESSQTRLQRLALQLQRKAEEVAMDHQHQSMITATLSEKPL